LVKTVLQVIPGGQSSVLVATFWLALIGAEKDVALSLRNAECVCNGLKFSIRFGMGHDDFGA
jgi:hypothetical protein